MLDSSTDTQKIEKVLQYVAALIDEFKVSIEMNRLCPRPDSWQLDALLSTEKNVDKILQSSTYLLSLPWSVVLMISIDTLDKLRHVPYASLDSQIQDGCMEGTRVGVLASLVSWSVDPTASPIFWLSGMAGTGKSTIAWSLCKLLKQSGHLAGSFFCLRGSADRGDAARILPTLAHLFAQRNAAYAESLVGALTRDGDAAHKRVDQQTELLLRAPLVNAVEGEAVVPSFVFVLDALDECADQTEVEKLLLSLLSVIPALPVKVLLTSRPEQRI